MDTILKATLWGKNVAAVSWDKDKEYTVIEFYESFIQNGYDIAPLTMPFDDLERGERIFSFPTHKNKTFKGLPGLLADSLPDDYGNTVIDEWFASQRLSVTINPIDRLCYIGKRGMGAIEFEPAIDQFNDSSVLEIEQLTHLAKQVLNQRESFAAKLQEGDKNYMDIMRVGTSAGGAKPKAIIAYNDLTREVRSGQVKAPKGFSYWLLKFDGIENAKIKDNPMGIGCIEYAYYLMAIESGINMTECRLFHEGNYSHFMTKRFDRSEDGDKLHTQTFCAIAHYDRDERYSYEQLFTIMRKLYLPYDDMEQMYRRMVFNILARNHDDHTKNHSFIMDKSGEWSLAPAYDLCFSYSPSGKWTNQHQLSVNGKRDNFTKNDLLVVSRKADIRNAESIITQISEVVSQWGKYAYTANVKSEHSEQILKTLRLEIK